MPIISSSFGGIDGVELRGWNRLETQNCVKYNCRSLSLKRAAQGGHLVKHRAETEQVAARIEIIAARLFGRHINDGADRHSGICRHFNTSGRNIPGDSGGIGSWQRGGGLGQAEVENFHVAALREENVSRLDVPMDDSFGVRGIKSVRNLNRNVEQLVDGQRAFENALGQRLALEQLHDDEVPALVLGNLMDGANVRMIQSGSGARFALEPLEGLGIILHVRRKEFQRHVAAEDQVLGFIDDSHSTSAELVEHAVVRVRISDHRAPSHL